MSITKERLTKPDLVKAIMKHSYTYFNDWFSMTWLASHIRFVEIGVAKEIEAEDFLIYILLRDPTSPENKLQDWLINMELVAIDKQFITNHLQHAENDFEEGVKDGHLDFDDLVLPWSENKVENFEWGFALKAKESTKHKKPLSSKHNFGPTDITIWSQREKVYFLETHNES